MAGQRQADNAVSPEAAAEKASSPPRACWAPVSRSSISAASAAWSSASPAGCADAFTRAGNALAATYLNAKAEGYPPLEPAPGRYVHE